MKKIYAVLITALLVVIAGIIITCVSVFGGRSYKPEDGTTGEVSDTAPDTEATETAEGSETEKTVATSDEEKTDPPVTRGEQGDRDEPETPSETTEKKKEPIPDGNKTSKARVTSFALLKAENRNLTEDISWNINGNTISGKVKCILDPGILKSARLTVKVSAGEGSFDTKCLNPDGSVNLLSEDGCRYIAKDESGNTVTYQVKTEYVPFDLPVVMIEVEGGKQVESDTEYANATVKIDGSDKGLGIIKSTPVQIRGRGHSTWTWEKKPYQIKFDVKTSVLGMPAAKRWVLLANYMDKSLIRNNVAMALAEKLGFAWTSSMYPVNVFVNGEYDGVYDLCEKVEIASGRMSVKKGNGVDCGFLIEIGGKEDGDRVDYDYFHLDILKYLAINYPDEQDRNPDRTYYIRTYMQKVEDAIVSGGDYASLLDVDSVVDWLIMEELTYNLDACFRRSCYLMKDAGGKLRMATVWDFDTGFGNMWADHGNYNAWASLSQYEGYIKDNWIVYLMKDPAFRAKFRARWNAVKGVLYNTANSVCDSLYNEIAPSAKYNFKRWNILGKVVGCEPALVKNYATYELQVQYLKNFIAKRWSFIDNNIAEDKIEAMFVEREEKMKKKAEEDAKKEAEENKSGD